MQAELQNMDITRPRTDIKRFASVMSGSTFVHDAFASQAPVRRIDLANVITIAQKELRDSLRNKWFILYTVSFSVLALGLSWLSLAGTGSFGFAGYGRTAASLINLVMLIVPLMALTAGAGSLAPERERGTLNYLLSQPVTTFEVLAGKYVGLAIAMLGALALGFGTSAAAIAAGGAAAVGGARGSGAADLLGLVAVAYALSLAMLSIGFLISAWAPRASVALASAIVVWLLFVFVCDLGLMGCALAFKLPVQQLLALSLINPLQVFKMAALSNVHATLDVLGPAGLYATQTYGKSINVIFAGALLTWIIAPLAMSHLLLKWRGGA